MNGTIGEIAARVCQRCHAQRCDRDGCTADLTGAPSPRVIVDMDCKELRIPSKQKRCDYLFFGEEKENGTITINVAPIELKSGRVGSSRAVSKQLEEGARLADGWLPESVLFRFIPILVHGKAIHKNDRRNLLSRTITLRGKKRRIVTIKCGDPLKRALLR